MCKACAYAVRPSDTISYARGSWGKLLEYPSTLHWEDKLSNGSKIKCASTRMLKNWLRTKERFSVERNIPLATHN